MTTRLLFVASSLTVVVWLHTTIHEMSRAVLTVVICKPYAHLSLVVAKFISVTLPLSL